MTHVQKPIMLRDLAAEPVEISAGQLPAGHAAWEIKLIQNDEDQDGFPWPPLGAVSYFGEALFDHFWVHAMTPTTLTVVMGRDVLFADVQQFCIDLQKRMEVDSNGE